MDHVSDKLKITDGETTGDNNFTLERVACLGCCGMAPVVAVDSNFYGECTIEKLDNIIQSYKKKGS